MPGGPLVGGLIGGAMAAAQHDTAWPVAVLHWWAGDGIGVLVVAAPILLWRKQSHILRDRLAETVLVMAVTAALSVAAFWIEAPPSLVLLPVLAWAAFRLRRDQGPRWPGGARVRGELHDRYRARPFAEMNLAQPARLAVTQAFIAVVVLVAMLIAQGRPAGSPRSGSVRPNDANATGCRRSPGWPNCCPPRSPRRRSVMRWCARCSTTPAPGAEPRPAAGRRPHPWVGDDGRLPAAGRRRVRVRGAAERRHRGHRGGAFRRPVVIHGPRQYRRRYPANAHWLEVGGGKSW